MYNARGIRIGITIATLNWTRNESQNSQNLYGTFVCIHMYLKYHL